MEREGKVFASPAEAAEAERRAMWALTVAERMEIARVLRERVYGASPPDVRASHVRSMKAAAGRPKELDDLQNLPVPGEG